MELLSAKQEFLQFIKTAGKSLKELSPYEGLELMLRFYQEVRVDGGQIDADGDMLLYQWGCYKFIGRTEGFDLDLTRQLILGDGEDDDIYQLSLTFRFKPNDALRQISVGSRWCPSPEKLADFREFIYNSAAYTAIAQEVPFEVDLDFECAG